MANQPTKTPYLVMHQGPRPQQAFSLKKNLLTLGRAEDNDIVIDDAEVSRYHARLTWQGDKWVIEDLGSSNGTYINGQRISAPTILAAGSQLRLGPDVVLGMQAGAPGGKHLSRKRKFPLSVGLAGAAVLGILVLGVLAALSYVYLSGNWPFGLAQGAVPSGPTVIIQEPVPGTQIVKGDSFMVFVSSHDKDGVTRIDLWTDDLLLLSQASPDEGGMTPFTLNYPLVAVETGSYALIARAYNSQGEMGESAVHYVTVYDVNASRQDLAQYIVQEGDTLENIAGKVGVPESTIGAVNP
ncbi:MAG: FHA domain-containing protein, partial [Chloroflexi bacterium]|nr:FHA domain-containing protein [Chloroflexota bacterium]